MTIYSIIEELNKENGSNYKMDVLRKYQDNELLKEVLKMTYDKTITYGCTLKNTDESLGDELNIGYISLEFSLSAIMDNLSTRKYTGNIAIQLVNTLLKNSNKENKEIIKGIINRDLRINLGSTNINKVFKNLIVKMPYMRCSLMDKIDKIKYPARSDKKEDGTYRSILVNQGEVQALSRAGISDDFPIFFNKIKSLPSGVYIGEFLIKSLPGSKNRMKANGLINSDEEQEDMYFSTWDYLTLDEFREGKSSTIYEDRRSTLWKNIMNSDSNAIELVQSRIVNSFEEAKAHYNELIAEGMEGTVLKNCSAVFKNGTSQEQIKMKESAVSEVIITGYQEGKGKFVGTLGAIEYSSSCSEVQGSMGGLCDSDREYIWEHRDELLNTIVSVKYNGVTKAKNSSTYSLMFANFVELRPEKDIADDLTYIKNALK